MSRDPRAFAQELRADAAFADAMAAALRQRADGIDGTDADCPFAREAARIQVIRDSLTGGYVGLQRGVSENS